MRGIVDLVKGTFCFDLVPIKLMLGQVVSKEFFGILGLMEVEFLLVGK